MPGWSGNVLAGEQMDQGREEHHQSQADDLYANERQNPPVDLTGAHARGRHPAQIEQGETKRRRQE